MMRNAATEVYPSVSWRNHGPFCLPLARAILSICPGLSSNLSPRSPSSFKSCSATLGRFRAGRRSTTYRRPQGYPRSGEGRCRARPRHASELREPGGHTADVEQIRADRAPAYPRDHLRALAQRVEVAESEVRIMGSKSRLLQTLVANGGANSVPTQGLKWRRGGDSNPRYPRGYAAFRVRCFQPLSHLSGSDEAADWGAQERGRGT